MIKTFNFEPKKKAFFSHFQLCGEDRQYAPVLASAGDREGGCDGETYIPPAQPEREGTLSCIVLVVSLKRNDLIIF